MPAASGMVYVHVQCIQVVVRGSVVLALLLLLLLLAEGQQLVPALLWGTARRAPADQWLHSRATKYHRENV